MIELVPQSGDSAGPQLRLWPPRALAAWQFGVLAAVLAGSMWLVALLGWRMGNAYAPAFALLDSGILAVALLWAWRSGSRAEIVAFGPDWLEVRRPGRAGVVFRAHPNWVRLRVTGEDSRVWLACCGRSCEIGAGLGPDERRQLAARMRAVLAEQAGAAGAGSELSNDAIWGSM